MQSGLEPPPTSPKARLVLADRQGAGRAGPGRTQREGERYAGGTVAARPCMTRATVGALLLRRVDRQEQGVGPGHVEPVADLQPVEDLLVLYPPAVDVIVRPLDRHGPGLGIHRRH